MAIIAILATLLGTFIGSAVAAAQTTRDRQTLQILNDALTRYKCEGGDLNALTYAAPMSNVLAKLTGNISWNGFNHSVMQVGSTYRARSICGLGMGKGYRFTRFNTYDAIAQGTTSLPDSFGDGVGYMDSAGAGYTISYGTKTTSGWLALKDTLGNITIKKADGSTNSAFVQINTPVILWSCASSTNSAPSGDITVLALLNYNTSLLKLDISGLGKLQTLNCLGCKSLTQINAQNCTCLTGINTSSCHNLKTLNIGNCISLQSLDIHNQDYGISNRTSLLNTLYQSLPTFTSGTHTIILDQYAASADDALATSKGWVVQR